MILRLFSIIFIGMTVNIYIPVAPTILGALVDYQGLTTDLAGRLISYNFFGATVSTIFAIFILHRPGWNIRGTLCVCILLIVATSAGSVWFAGDMGALGLVRFLNGCGAGLGFTTCCVAVVGTPHVERSYALLYGLPFMISGIGMALLPYAYKSVGIEGVFYGMGVLNIFALGVLPFVPKTLAEQDSSKIDSGYGHEKGLFLLGAVVIVSLFLHYVFNSGIWTYFERLGVATGMSAEKAGALLGPSMTAAILGMVAASVLGSKIGYLRPIYIGF
ncbi:MAG: MFS transporter, partial [Woeseia sp.]